MSGLPQVATGDELPGRSVPITRAGLVRYAGASGDLNPIHWNERTALAVGLPGVIAHGMLTMALAAQYVADWAGDPAAVRSFSTRFTRPVVVPDDDGQTARLLADSTPADDGEAWGAVPEERWGRIYRDGVGLPVPSLPGAWDQFYARLARALRGDAALPVDPWDSVAALEVLDAARVSAATGRVAGLGTTARDR